MLAEIGSFESGRIGCQSPCLAAELDIAVHNHDGFIGHLEGEADVLLDENHYRSRFVRDAPDNRQQSATAAGGKSTNYKRYYQSKHSKDDPPPAPVKESSTFSSLFGVGKH